MVQAGLGCKLAAVAALVTLVLGPLAAAAQDTSGQVPEVAGYQLSSTSSGTSVLGGGGQVLREPGTPYTGTMREMIRTDTAGVSQPGDSLDITATVLLDTEQGMFLEIAEIGLCGVVLRNGPFLACQVPARGGTRPLTEMEARWVTWSGQTIDGFLDAQILHGADPHGDVAGIASTLPSPRVAAYIQVLQSALGADAPVVQQAQDIWARTADVIGLDPQDNAAPLFDAISAGDDGRVQALLEGGADPDAVSVTGEPALRVAARSGNAAIVASLLMHGGDPTQAVADGDLALDGEVQRLLDLAAHLRSRAAPPPGDPTPEAAQPDTTTEDLRAELAATRAQLDATRAELDLARDQASAANPEIDDLKSRLNTALAAAAADQQSNTATLEARIEDLTERLRAETDRNADLATKARSADIIGAALGAAFDPRSAPAVRYVQSRLNDLGYDAGPADGQIGRRTRDAISSFQTANGLENTGAITADLVVALARSGTN